MIPKNLFRTVPERTSEASETWWKWAVDMHQGWNCVTYRDPLDPADFPLTSPYWDACQHGAQMAGLVRLELVYTQGGVYIDSDVQVYRSFDPLRLLPAFAGWEDERVVPDAIFGAEAGHHVIGDCLKAACKLVEMGYGPWDTGPGVFTDLLPSNPDVLVLPPASFYPYHYSRKRTADAKKNHGANPWCYAVHHWNASWVPKR